MAYGDGTGPYQTRSGRWVGAVDVGWTERGTRRRRTVSAKTRAECARRLRDLKREINAAQGAAPAASQATVKRWADEWLPIQAGRLRPKAYAVTEGMVRRWIIPTLGNRRLADLTARDARRLDQAVIDAGRSSTTARTCRATLARMLRDARREGHPVPQAILDAEPPKRAASTRRAIPVDGAIRLLRAAASRDQWPDPGPEVTGRRLWARHLAERVDPSRWVAALLQGMRQGECLGLTWDRVDLDAGTITVDRQLQAIPRRAREAGTADADWYAAEHLAGTYYLVPVKSAAGRRVIPLVPWMAGALATWREQCPASPWGLVWPRPAGGPWSSGDDLRAWRALQEVAGVARPDGRPYTVHEARHSAATLLMALQVPAPVQVAIMGHSSIAVTQGYQHADLEGARRALEGVAGLLQIEA
ncbi:hypothetical protein CWT12_12140 [Actinomyces sp. 432]|uniref:tyrosine-type recombinase/integrase n=1 Tax=Actinomyces sp. 432 TaxID=2057798 RepID=UPI001373B4CB|nr:site-specific integrase [Actinomyces sp. 432]QHO91902.1 hypothetical protein CWT12_12140 [Actinomyces sp. 432]